MKIKSVRARVFEWKGKTVPPQGNFCSNAMDLVYSKTETMHTFRFHSWTVVEIETDDGIVGLGNVALAPKIAKAIIDILNVWMTVPSMYKEPFRPYYKQALRGLGVADPSGALVDPEALLAQMQKQQGQPEEQQSQEEPQP